MKKYDNRISLTITEADEIREYLETLYAMEGTLDEDFNHECHRAGFYARKLCELIYGHRNPSWMPMDVVQPKYDPTK